MKQITRMRLRRRVREQELTRALVCMCKTTRISLFPVWESYNEPCSSWSSADALSGDSREPYASSSIVEEEDSVPLDNVEEATP